MTIKPPTFSLTFPDNVAIIVILCHDMGVFEGAAYYYDKYRPGVPDELVDSIMEDMDCAPDTLLDLGTATGNVLEQFAPRFKRIISVEPDVKMLEYAK
jgi:ubiquinone/menaquinone biosynthesis C-methylase UbiE